jgi:hypothetical protein
MSPIELGSGNCEPTITGDVASSTNDIMAALPQSESGGPSFDCY